MSVTLRMACTNSKLGIGIVTYRRPDHVSYTVSQIRRHTQHDFVMAVADDGSGDATLDTLRRMPEGPDWIITGSNSGVAWNKNRVLFFLAMVHRCDVIIILEDDCYPTEYKWESEWIEASNIWGHINYACPWFNDRFISGHGTPLNPFLCPAVSGQCSAFTHAALSYVGFLDPRFGRLGGEHAEHSYRMVKAGFGGTATTVAGALHPSYFLLNSPLQIIPAVSHFADPSMIAGSVEAFLAYKDGPIHRTPWANQNDFQRFQMEMQTSIDCERKFDESADRDTKYRT